LNVILPETVKLIQWSETFKPRRYRDKKKGGGAWAIFYGHTENLGTEPRIITEDMEGTEAEGAIVLARDLEVLAPQMMRSFNDNVVLNDWEFGALLSMFYNMSPETFRETEVVKRLNDPPATYPREKAADAFLLHDKAWDEEQQISRPYLGLRRRRKMESAFFEGILEICKV
jgi:GH24 family phage-related lysozyme (muramidase)